jgi:hypothetical protein
MMFSSLFLSDYLIYIWFKFQSLADLCNLLFFKLIFFFSFIILCWGFWNPTLLFFFYFSC